MPREAHWVAGQVAIDEVYAEVLPDEKAEKIKEIKQQGLLVAMTGDGVNDVPALARAVLGIAIGVGTDVAMETADLVLVRSNPKDVVSLIVYQRKPSGKWFKTCGGQQVIIF